MKKSMMWILALSSLIFHTQVSANWTYIASASNGSNWYLNFDSLKEGGGFRKFTSLRQDLNGEISAQSGWVDCAYPAGHRKWQFEEFASYLAGQPWQIIKTNDSQFNLILPGSVLETLTNSVCQAPRTISQHQKSAYVPFEISSPHQPYIARSNTDPSYGVNQTSGGCAENGSCYGNISVHTGRPKTVHVDGYYRRDGTYVRGHYRSSPRR